MAYPFPTDALGRYLVPLRIIVVDYAENTRDHGRRPVYGYAGVAELVAEELLDVPPKIYSSQKESPPKLKRC